MRRLIAFLPLALALPICVFAAELDLSVPVRVLRSAPQRQAENMPAQPPPVDPPATRALLPQYQDASAFRTDVSNAPDPASSAMRFVVALPDRLLLLEATVMIDGKPFEMIREQRIERLIAELKKPAAEPVSTDAGEDSDAKEEADSSEAAANEESVSDNSSEEPAGEDEPAEGADEEQAEPDVPLIPVASTALDARLRRYATVTGRPPTRDEVRWLLTKWVDGPTLLLLDDNFQRFRATQAPAFRVLDRDMDGTVSEKELKAAHENLLACDTNQNDVVEYTEIAEVADDPRHKNLAAPAHGLIPILDAAAVASAFRRLAKRYAAPDSLKRFDGDSDGELNADEIAKLGEIAPDVTVAVSFNTADAAKSTTKITQISSDLSGTKELQKLIGPWITIPVGGTLLEFSAVQSAALSSSDQISIGVVNDGYPLLPAIDPNEDGRLTIREMREVMKHLQRFDVNEDGGISQEEIPSTVRVSFGLGPSVHQHLADIRTVHAPTKTPKVDAPNWFTQMDANRDGDISPREFTLKREIFKELDADNDGLVSPQEAIKLTGSKPKETPDPKPEEPKATP
jgi:Ca2+-binding EF-hand superfamily protein